MKSQSTLVRPCIRPLYILESPPFWSSSVKLNKDTICNVHMFSLVILKMASTGLWPKRSTKLQDHDTVVVYPTARQTIASVVLHLSRGRQCLLPLHSQTQSSSSGKQEEVLLSKCAFYTSVRVCPTIVVFICIFLFGGAQRR
jgi:hypothetical protein